MNIFALIYLDEDVSNLVARLLRSRGIDVQTVQECQMLGKSDPEQLSYAISVNRCILTHNRVDYEKLHLQYINQKVDHSGIIVVPQKIPYEIVARTMVLLDRLTADELENQLFYI
ncbi:MULTISPECIES: DUF5615 family PIN-like protein [Pseudanabaena]|uniref:DUF5615 domain-containing protein n=2 Tax=Pseudanabaena TaxID=1152 RepID=L8N369_9CYAN|nr:MULTISPECIES: DUF5615 family PIN-like protein [Pseudanabaena]ELS32693.1 hypothetical protein Pse7429DRAFT_2435 [Pseudanabaena biceps PCC 7429]MDG3495082.1 DUF5615 family PIN-like protein [Pseudanabaena catenata USMAC16]